ncbi:aa3-type cytochrome c oxidase subunit IV [Martelella alba]|uniref:Aa3-type cytochrome c oxidase subunit IV n=1 Tax=Martelella alba TaxID=2590451 RepID=A0A506UDD3_9HYPH|nr:aa3-type cytochrome c oxidase subunit IV [Martelella alba]TPW30815.1 aa3-type cytochrome c oxidase subunit IV [Martelella alba]
MQHADMNDAAVAQHDDFAEHERTYRMFLRGTRVLTVLVIALLLGMAAGLIGPFGFLGGLILFIFASAIGLYSFR